MESRQIRGAFDKGTGPTRNSGCNNRCFSQTTDVEPGQRLTVSARLRRQSSGLGCVRLQWIDAGWLADEDIDVYLVAQNHDEVAAAAVSVPEDASNTVVSLTAREHDRDGQGCFDDVRMAPIALSH